MYMSLGIVGFQGRIQDFYDGVSISKKLQEYIAISFDQLMTM